MRCGGEYLLWDGAPSECNPDSKIFCCNNLKGLCVEERTHKNIVNYKELKYRKLSFPYPGEKFKK